MLPFTDSYGGNTLLNSFHTKMIWPSQIKLSRERLKLDLNIMRTLRNMCENSACASKYNGNYFTNQKHLASPKKQKRLIAASEILYYNSIRDYKTNKILGG